jgi:hypothetical protein
MFCLPNLCMGWNSNKNKPTHNNPRYKKSRNYSYKNYFTSSFIRMGHWNTISHEFHIIFLRSDIMKCTVLYKHKQSNPDRWTSPLFYASVKNILLKQLYRVSIKSFPDYKHLLRENYCTWNTNIFFSKCNSVSFSQHISTLQYVLLFFQG